jgi:hypothetical protein
MSPCKPGKEKNANGRCVKIKGCADPNKEKNANGRCVKKCQPHQHRNSKGVCMPRDKPKARPRSLKIKKFDSAELSYQGRQLRHVLKPGTRQLHRSSSTQKLKPKLDRAELSLQGRELKHVSQDPRKKYSKRHYSHKQNIKSAELSLQGRELKRHIKPAHRYAPKLSSAKKKLRHVSKPGTRKMHTSSTQKLKKRYKAAELALAKKKLKPPKKSSSKSSSSEFYWPK